MTPVSSADAPAWAIHLSCEDDPPQDVDDERRRTGRYRAALLTATRVMAIHVDICICETKHDGGWLIVERDDDSTVHVVPCNDSSLDGREIHEAPSTP